MVTLSKILRNLIFDTSYSTIQLTVADLTSILSFFIIL